MERVETLAYADCWALLESSVVGRVVFTEGALPAIRPVNFSVVGRHLLLRVNGQGLATRLDRQIVAFEIDHVDPDTMAGWSVVVMGTARRVTNADELARLAAVPLAAWAGENHATSVLITPGDVQGRRIPAQGGDLRQGDGGPSTLLACSAGS